MTQPGPHQGLYALRCIRCGSNLELPHDPALFHIDCRFCGTDNVLPAHLIEARQRHHAATLEHQHRARVQAERDAANKRSSRVLLVIFGGLGFLGLASIGTCVAIGVVASNQEDEARQRAADPKLNGNEVILAQMAKMRADNGCDRILVQPDQHRNEDGVVSLDMVANNHCVHVLGATGTGALISMKYSGKVALTRPLPAPAPFVDYRLCASETATHSFTLTTPEEPFTLAALECPRTPAEGGARSKANDPLTTGKTRASKAFSEFTNQGCRPISEPAVYQGAKTFTLTSKEKGSCYHLAIASHYADVGFGVSLTDPSSQALPVPAPAQEMRVSYCPEQAGKYTLAITPSTNDHYSLADVDCPREARGNRAGR
jgi:hypothetical protein